MVYKPDNQPDNSFQVAGVVCSYPTPILEPIVNRQGQTVVDKDNNPIGFRENPGFVLAYNIRHAIELINAIPIGFPLNESHSP